MCYCNVKCDVSWLSCVNHTVTDTDVYKSSVFNHRCEGVEEEEDTEVGVVFGQTGFSGWLRKSFAKMKKRGLDCRTRTTDLLNNRSAETRMCLADVQPTLTGYRLALWKL